MLTRHLYKYVSTRKVKAMGDETFWQLCLNGESENVKTAIDNGVDVNETDMANISGLMWALRRGHNNVVQLLLHHPEIDVNKIDLDGNSGLHWAVSSDNYEGLEALLHRQDLTGINQKHSWGQTAIMEAISCNALNCFHVLLNNLLADLDTRDNYRRNAEEVIR